MKVEFNPLKVNTLSFSQDMRKSPNFTSGDLETEVQNIDEFKSEAPSKASKKGLKEGFAGVWKFFAKFDAMTQALFKGIFYGFLTSAGFMAGSWLFKSLPSVFAKEGPKLIDIIKHPIKTAPKSSKIIAGLIGGLVFAGNVISGIFSSNQKTAVIDHKLKTGHRDS